MTADVLDRFARGDLDEGQLTEVLRHLETCESCARAGEARAANDLAALRAEWAAEPAARTRVPMWTIAAAAAIAIAIVSALVIPKKRPSDFTRSPAIATTPKAAPTVLPPTPISAKTAEAYADPEWQRFVDGAIKSGRLPFPADLRTLRASPDTVRGSGGSVDRISPAAVVIDDVRPTFSWPSRDGGTYIVSVFHGDREVMHSAPLSVPRWAPDRDLPRGRTLAWQVEVTGGDSFETIPSPPSPPATFRIVSETGHRDVVRARSLHGNDHLLLAVLYARNGMRAEALESLRRAAAGNDAAKRILAHETSSPQ